VTADTTVPVTETQADNATNFDLFEVDLDLDDDVALDTGFLSDTDLDSDAEPEADFLIGDLSDPSVWKTYGKRLRGLVSNFQAAHNIIKYPFMSSGGQRLFLQIQVLAFKHPKKSLGKWQPIFRDVVSPPDNPAPYNVEDAIQRILDLLPTESKRKIRFKGSQHCEASLAAMGARNDILVPVSQIHCVFLYLTVCVPSTDHQSYWCIKMVMPGVFPPIAVPWNWIPCTGNP
jgi:hypothetical protein